MSVYNGMVVLPRTLFCQSTFQICNEIAVIFATLSNLTSPVFIRDPSIQHGGVVTNRQKRFDSCLSGAHFLDKKMYRISFCTRLQKVIMKPSAKGKTVLDCIDEDICVGGSYHCRFIIFVVLFVRSCRVGISKSYAQKKKHRKHLMLN
jgi:hypothetical protein